MPPRRIELHGNNGTAFQDQVSRELLVSGPAGSGKTLANLLKLYLFLDKYPKSRLLIVRKTRHSLTESALVTWERDVLGDGHPILARPIERSHRHQYRHPTNGSVLVTGGMDKPDKILSTEWDLIYAPEATELTITDWESLGGRLRAGAGPFDQLLGDCNPTTPTHWLYKRCKEGRCRLYETTHRDNPRYYDRLAKKWTEAGARYLARLGNLTGPRRKRFLEGKWVAAEGCVYDGFDAKRHLLPKGWKPPRDWPRVWGLDWGYTNPLCMQFWAIDSDGRMHLYRERYQTRLRVEQLAKWVDQEVTSGREPLPVGAVCDHDPECKATFEHYTGVKLEMAEKSDKDGGIEQLQARFDDAGDGRPRIFFVPDALDHPPDPALIDSGKPISTLDELPGYVWDTTDPDRPKDVPVDRNNHGCDSARYSTRWIDNFVRLGAQDGFGGDREALERQERGERW